MSSLLSKYTNQVTQAELVRKIEEIQLSPIKKFFKGKINLIRAICNYGLTAGTNLANDIIRNYYSYLPPVNESQIKDILPQINFAAETDFNSSDASYYLLMRLCSLINHLGYGKTAIFFDKFDEDSRMENNAEIISNFIAPLLADNKLLENPDIQLIISVWEVPFNRIADVFRTQKHYCPMLCWPTQYLIEALNRRISVFSNGAITNFKLIFDANLNSDVFDEIFNLSNGNPRDLWHILDYIFQEQYSIDCNCKALSQEAIFKALDDFVINFNFYEYYPKKPKAKSSTMDIYSYINHLLKLSSERFTKNQLNDLAKTGSSTSNYVVGMEKIGLIINTKEKENAGVLYQINDLKVVYAMKKQLDISK